MPVTDAASLGRALQARVAAESHLRFNLCVDNMPTDDLPALTQAQHARIQNWAVNSKKLAKFGEASGMLAQLVQEVQREYNRALNKCVLTDSFQDKTQRQVFSKLSLPLHAVPPILPAPLVGTVPMAKYDYWSLSHDCGLFLMTTGLFLYLYTRTVLILPRGCQSPSSRSPLPLY